MYIWGNPLTLSQGVMTKAQPLLPVCIKTKPELRLSVLSLACAHPHMHLAFQVPRNRAELFKSVCPSLLQGIFPTRDPTQVSLTASRFFTSWATRDAQAISFPSFPPHTV